MSVITISRQPRVSRGQAAKADNDLAATATTTATNSRSTYTDEHRRWAEELVDRGANEVELAAFFGVHRSTITRWKQRDPLFAMKLLRAAAMWVDGSFDPGRAERVLYERAIGYEYIEERIHIKARRCYNKLTRRFSTKISQLIVVEQTVHVLPNVQACKWALRHLSPEVWRNKPRTESQMIIHMPPESEERQSVMPVNMVAKETP